MVFLNRLLSLATLATAASSAEAGTRKRSSSMPYLRQADLNKYLSEQSNAAGVDGQWVSVSEDVEFMPTNLPPLTKPRKARKLDEEEDGSTTGSWEEYDPYSVQPFVEGMSEYDEYQQAWRLLGFMIDCNTVDDDDGGSGSGSGDQGTEDGCARYVLWAAYVDLDYEGGGIGEYQYWDRDTQSWNDTACYYADGDGGGDDAYGYKSRCAKMDCHLDDTNFSVLGFFKHRNYDDWMEQLFKHEGMCVWTEEEYAFMKNARKAWPQGCVDSGSTTSGGQTLYYNIKPSRYGRINLGMYTDSQCLDEYSISTDKMEDIIGNLFTERGGSGSGSQDGGDYDFSGDSLSESLERWHSAFDVWHTCHPCVAYDIENLNGDKYTDDDNYYYNNYNNYNRKLGGEYSAEGDVFECYDDAGYTNVNQCMKFSAKTVMKTATFRDLSLGRTQATLVEYPLSGFFVDTDHYHRNTMSNIGTYALFSITVIGLLYSVFNLYVVWKNVKVEKPKTAANGDSLLPAAPSM